MPSELRIPTSIRTAKICSHCAHHLPDQFLSANFATRIWPEFDQILDWLAWYPGHNEQSFYCETYSLTNSPNPFKPSKFSKLRLFQSQWLSRHRMATRFEAWSFRPTIQVTASRSVRSAAVEAWRPSMLAARSPTPIEEVSKSANCKSYPYYSYLLPCPSANNTLVFTNKKRQKISNSDLGFTRRRSAGRTGRIQSDHCAAFQRFLCRFGGDSGFKSLRANAKINRNMNLGQNGDTGGESGQRLPDPTIKQKRRLYINLSLALLLFCE